MIRILVVEDDRDISALIQLALKNAGYDVFAAFDGQEGANLLETQKFELCLLDIMLPQISGYELFSYINEYSIPVIFITARGELDDKRKAFRMGADDYIVKPFEIEELLLRTENILRLHGYKNNLLRVGDVELDAEAHIVRKAGREITLTPKEFELLTMMALKYFAEEKVDIVVLEVGLGGRLDSTNIVNSQLSVIMSIGLDHCAILGSTVEAIAGEKAGIIKPGSPVVSYGGVPEADAVIARTAAERHAPLTVVDLSRLTIEDGDLDAVTFDFDGLNGIRLPLIGSYQPRNAATAITALRVLRSRGWNIPDSAIRAGLEQVRWPGRFELLRHSPAFLLDGSHNAHGMRATVQSLRDRFPGQKFVFLLSIMADKDVDEMLALLLPLAGQFVTVAAHTPRAMPAETLAEQIRARGGRAEPASTIEAGVARAVALGGTGPVCALGTLYFSGDVREAFAKLNQ